MSPPKGTSTATNRDAPYYAAFLAELEEIRTYKWIESQKAGEDIGFERALTEWAAKHREIWLEEVAANKLV